MSSLSLSNAEILRAIGLVTGYKRSASDWEPEQLSDARAVIRAGLRKFFHPMPFHQWRFLERQFVASGEAVFDTGTIAATDGTVTLTGGTWPDWAADAVLRIGSQTYYVDSVTNTTVLVLKDTGYTADAGTAFEMYRWRYPLPDDFGELIGGCVYSNGGESRMLQGATESEIRKRNAVNFQVGRPTRFAIYAGGGNDDSTWYFTAWPLFDDGAFSTATYRSEPVDNLDAADLTADGAVVQIDAVHAETMLAAVMSAAEEYYNDNSQGPHTQRFQSRLMASIEHDRHAQGAVSFDCPAGADPRRLALLNHLPQYNDLL